MVRKLARHLGRNAVAWVALFVALGGVSYAAIRIPANSVGNRQLKRNAVTNSKVKAHSLTARVFKKGTLLRGAIGPQGPQGPKGATGATGATGPVGPSNATEAFHNAAVAAPASTATTVLTLSGLPAGAYVISAKTVGVATTAAAESVCTLTAGDQSDQSTSHVNVGESATQYTQLTQTFAGTGTATLSCNPGAGSAASYTQTKIVAIKVGAESHTAT